MPAVPLSIIGPIFEQFAELLPDRTETHPLGCHNPRIPDKVVFEKLVQVLVFGCAYEKIADESCSATTLRRRRDEWIDAGVMERLREMVLDGYDRMVGLDLSDVAVDCCITKAPCAGEKAGKSPVDRGKQGIKRSVVVDANGIPLGAIAAPAKAATTRRSAGSDPGHHGGGYDSKATRERLRGERGFLAEISEKGKSAPIAASKRWTVERTNSWSNAHKKLVWCTERVASVIDFWLAFSAVIITVRRLVREGWVRYRWEGRPCRRP